MKMLILMKTYESIYKSMKTSEKVLCVLRIFGSRLPAGQALLKILRR